MTPTQFAEANKILTKPPGMTDDQCGSLPTYSDGERTISCWRPSWRERLSILFFGRVWLWVWSGPTQPPVALSGERTIFVKPAKTWRAFVDRVLGKDRWPPPPTSSC